MAASLSVSSYLISASKGLVANVPGALRLLLDAGEFLLLVAGLAALYRYVPNTPVRRAHAWIGAAFTALGLEVARRLLAAYISAVPAYSAVYGAFATVPILLVWIYMGWLVILLGAVLAADLPALTAGLRRREGAGWSFELALDALRALAQARGTPRHGLGLADLSQQLQVTDLQIEPVLQTLVTLDWVGRIEPAAEGDPARYVLLVDPQSTPLDPLVRELLLPDTASTARLWQSGRLAGLPLKDAL